MASSSTKTDSGVSAGLEELLSVAFAACPAPIAVADRETGELVAVNEAFREVLGLQDEDLLGKTTVELGIWPDPGRRGAIVDTLNDGLPAHGIEQELRTRDGRTIKGLFSAKIIHFEGGSYLLTTMQDITEHKLAEEALRERDAQLRSFFENAAFGIVVADPQGRCIQVNQHYLEMFGYADEKELFQRTIGELTHPDDRPATREAQQQLASGEISSFRSEKRYLRKDGSWFWGEASVVPIREHDGEIKAFTAVIFDLTDRKRAEEERRRLEAQLQQAQKLESLGVLSGGIAHDFNNLLAGIIGNADVALNLLSDISPARPCLEDVIRAGRRANDLTRQMLAYSGKGRFVVKPVNLSELVTELAHLLNASVSKTVKLNLDLSSDLPAVEADIAQLQQIVMNLITNASESFGDSGVGAISVETGVMDCTREYLERGYLVEQHPAGRYVYLEVADTGCGMDRETLGCIFDPFFTTKFTGRGLGLAAVIGIVRGHRGVLMVDSRPGAGSTFRILLPAMPGEVDTTDSRALPVLSEEQLRGQGLVLVVDDEALVLRLARRMLESAGFEVLTANDGVEGVELFAERADEISCVLLDLKMPRMGGVEACTELRRIRDDIPIVLSSGYGESEVTNDIDREQPIGFIQKPYERAELCRVLLATIDGTPDGEPPYDDECGR